MAVSGPGRGLGPLIETFGTPLGCLIKATALGQLAVDRCRFRGDPSVSAFTRRVVFVHHQQVAKQVANHLVAARRVCAFPAVCEGKRGGAGRARTDDDQIMSPGL